MVSHNDAIDIVGRALAGRQKTDDQTLASADILAERLDRVNRLGGVFEQIAFSPQMEAMLGLRQPAGAAGYAAV